MSEPTSNPTPTGTGSRTHSKPIKITWLSGLPGIFVAIFLIALLIRGCEGCLGCNNDDKCYDSREETVEIERGPTPFVVKEKDIPKKYEFDSFGPVLYLRPSSRGGYDTIPYPGGGVKIDFLKLYGNRGHGDLKFLSPSQNQPVTVVFYKREWIEYEVPCKDED